MVMLASTPAITERNAFASRLSWQILSSRFNSVSADAVDREIESAQRAICECLNFDHSGLWQVS
jgi:hypothetical protein